MFDTSSNNEYIHELKKLEWEQGCEEKDFNCCGYESKEIVLYMNQWETEQEVSESKVQKRNCEKDEIEAVIIYTSNDLISKKRYGIGV